MKTKLTRKQLGVLAIGAAALAALLLVRVTRDGSGEADGTDIPPAAAIQDPETSEPEPSKLKAYRDGQAGGAERLWDDLEESMDDPYGSRTSGREEPAKPRSQDDVLRDLTDGTRQSDEGRGTSAGTRRDDAPRPGDTGYREYRMRQYYENTDATVRRGEAAKDSAMAAASATPTVAEGRQPMEVIGEDLPVRRSSAMSSLDGGAGNGFSTLSDGEDAHDGTEYPFECMFVRAEKLREGSRVSVRLLEDMVVGGVLIPRNTHLMAMCAIGKRLELTVSSVEMNSRIYQLGYDAYDTDGGKGIYCPDLGGETRRSVQSRGLSSIGRVIGGRMGRLASEAVQTGVSVAQARNGEVTVSVPAGYRFFLVKKQK